MPPANNTLSVYLGKDLADRVQAAEQVDATFKATEFCKRHLIALFNGGESLDDALAAPAQELFEYEFVTQPTKTSAGAYLNDVVQPQGGYPVSFFVDLAGQYQILVAWPKK